MSPELFVSQNLPLAKAAEAKYGLPATLALAQSALETFWGQSVKGNNYFGIRADRSWAGPIVLITTKEDTPKGLVVMTGQRFRQYATPADSFMDWGAFLHAQPRYRKVLGQTSPYVAAAELAAAGYATDRAYAKKLVDMINSVHRRLPR